MLEKFSIIYQPYQTLYTVTTDYFKYYAAAVL